MGLDMSLKAEKYVGGWRHSSEQEKAEFEALVDVTGMTPTGETPSFTVSATVGYWRKANAVHRWFVEHVQGGRDECQRAYVERSQLATLRDACRKVLDTIETVEGDVSDGTTYYPGGRVEHHTHRGPVVAQRAIAEDTLPTQGGFFFGGTDYDEYYVGHLKKTVEIIDRVLSDESLKHCEFYYQASW